MKRKKKMRQVKLVTMLMLSAILLTMMAVPAMGATYEIKKLYNWGVTLNNSATKNIGGTTYETLDASDWLPSSSTADYVVEDNMDSKWSGDSQFKPTEYTGVHIYSKDPSWKEPKIKAYNNNWYIPPSGYYYTAPSREEYDIEAFYFDSDQTYAYFAIIYSKIATDIGDLALDLNNDGTYEYGIVLYDHETFKRGDVCSGTIQWSNPTDFPSEGPFRVISASSINKGAAFVDITDSGVPDFGIPNYVIEVKVQRTSLGNPSFSNMRATTSCGNDGVELENVVWEIPEFTTIAIPAGMIIGLFYLFRRKKQSKGG